MEFESVMEEELWDTIYYTKTLKDNTDLCIICQCDETEEGKQWDRYMTKCGHITHSRCCRRWCFRKGKMHCPYCGDIKSIKRNRFCIMCNKFGHSAFCDDCPTLAKLG